MNTKSGPGDHHDHYDVHGNELVPMKQGAIELVGEYLALLEIVETTDDGREFHPNQLGSCRVMDGFRMNQILAQLRKIVDQNNLPVPVLAESMQAVKAEGRLDVPLMPIHEARESTSHKASAVSQTSRGGQLI